PTQHAVRRHRTPPRDADARRLRLHPVRRHPRGRGMTNQRIRNRYGFGIGTIGRDAGYTLISMFLLFYLSDVLEVSQLVFTSVTAILVVVRVIDAVTDPVVGVFVDNTRSRWGKFKPWILVGVV